MNSGMDFLWDTPVNATIQVTIIAVLTLLFVLSATSGVEGRPVPQQCQHGDRRRDRHLRVPPGAHRLHRVRIGGGDRQLPLPVRPDELPYRRWRRQRVAQRLDHPVLGVVDLLDAVRGTFLARISQGRTIREYMLGVLLVPSAVSMVWFAIFGGAGIDAQRTGAADLIGAASEVSLFALLETYPFVTVTSVLVIFLVGLFFVSGADAASVVMGTMSPWQPPPASVGGRYVGCAHRRRSGRAPPQRGLDALQQVTIVMALPFIIIMLLLWLLSTRRFERSACRRRSPRRHGSPLRPTRCPGPPGGPTAKDGESMTDAKGPFHGFIDTWAEMSRMREHALGGGEQRTQVNAWVPTTDILVRGDDLIIRCGSPGSTTTTSRSPWPTTPLDLGAQAISRGRRDRSRASTFTSATPVHSVAA